ncbi:MAG: hypothetical protein K9J06_05960 [Flavobacteriales bacterium]|nr:hypothetical protein [Flavobacteriales bacterium]
MKTLWTLTLICALSTCATAQDLERMYNEGQHYFEIGEHGHAIAFFTGVIEYDPVNVPALVKRGMSFHETGEYERALADFTAIIGAEAENPTAYIERGRVHLSMANVRMACEDWKFALGLGDPTAKHLSEQYHCKP